MSVGELFSTPVKSLKMVMSVAILCGAMTVIFYGIGTGLALLPGPVGLHFFLLFFSVTLLAYLEGLQVAILALENLDYTVYREQYPKGVKLMDRATRPDAVKKFLCGRQFFVVFVVFLVAQLTTFPDFPAGGMPGWLFILCIDTGLSGALFVLMWGQLLPQITAADYPLQFCGLPGSMAVLYLCLVTEMTGVTDVSWLLAAGGASLTGAEPKAYKKREKNADGTWKSAGDDMNTNKKTSTTESHIQDDTEVNAYGQIQWDDIFALANKSLDKQLGPSDKMSFNKRPAEMTALDKVWPTPAQMRKQLMDEGADVPRYLLPVTHPQHIPPHLVAAQQLLAGGLVKEMSIELSPAHFMTNKRMNTGA